MNWFEMCPVIPASFNVINSLMFFFVEIILIAHSNNFADTKGILLINKAIILNENGNREEARQLLGHLIFSDNTTVGNIELAKFTLRSMAEK